MRSRGTYKVANTEESKAAQLDQSYRSCLMALIIFFFLCIIFILACLFAQKSGKDYQSIIAMSQTGSNRSTGKLKSLFIPDANIEPPDDLEYDSDETPESSPLPSEHPSSTEKYTPTTKQPNLTVTSSTEHYFVNAVQPISSGGTASPTMDNSTPLTPTDPNSTSEVQTSLAQNTTEQGIIESDNSTLPDNVKTSEPISIKWQSNSTETVTSVPTEVASGTTAIFSTDNSTQPIPRASYLTENLQTSPTTGTTKQSNLENGDSTLANNAVTSESASNKSQLTSTETVTSTNKDATITDNDMSSIPITFNKSTEDELSTWPSTNIQTKLVELVENVYKGNNISKDNTTTDTVTVEPEQNSVPSSFDNSRCTLNTCEDRGCKQVASKVLSYMDHWGNACVDFYEYACGSLEADYQISEKDLSRRAYEIIKHQAEKKSNHPRSAQFNRYYDSCINYEVTYNISERVKLAREALAKIGKFRTRTEWENGHGTKDLNELFANILQNDWPLLFDIVPDVNKANPEIFTLVIGPQPLVLDSKSFQSRHDPNRCENEDGTVSEDRIDFDVLYGKYVSCKKNTKRFMGSINETLSALHIFDNLEDNGDRSQSIELTINAIDIDIIKGILKKYSSKRKIHEAYRSKNYTVMTLGHLQGNRTSVNWTQLISSLTQSNLGSDAKLYVYNENELIEAMNELEELWKNRPHDLNNALLGLYAQYLYNTFVTPKSLRDLHNDCLYKAVHSMKDVASELYMQSFTDIEIERMNKVLKDHFDVLTETLRQNIKKINWATKLDQKRLLEKLDAIKMSLPNRLEEDEAKKLDINDNYFENSMKLMKKYRTTMYSMTKKKPLKEIWRFFASPFESTAKTIYALNLIAMPYGAVEVDMKTSTITAESINYLTLATIGNVIARQIAQNFDMTAMRYWNVFTDKKTKDTYENEYILCHQSLYEDSTVMNWTVTGKSLNVHFKVPTLSLNERLSDIVGLRLARDTLDRLSLNSTRPLPWSNLNVIQLFYLTYVQAHCTKAPLASLYISLNEDPFLPSRIRVYVASNNNGLFDKEWDCPLSTLAPPSECRAFPHLDDDE